MKRVVCTLVVLLFICTLAQAQSGKPNMVIDSMVHDAGIVIRTGAPLEYAFRIKNTGNGELKIFEVKPG